MALNSEQINVFNSKLDAIEALLRDNQDEQLFGKEQYYNFTGSRQEFEDNVRLAQEEGRTLQIGVIGAVKAGKSSFLNALLFDGEEKLPKAATPMTAALTKISYCEEPGAEIHFYSKKDWDQITDLSAEYDKQLENSYQQYLADANQRNKHGLLQNDGREKQRNTKAIMSKEDFERGFRKQPSMSESSMVAAKELTDMAAKNYGILDKLGENEIIGSDDLENYIGANGAYTPIVNYVELKMNDDRLKDIVIVDTPGLHDPIVSRGRKTMEFLSKCDVALLLSPTAQFMDANTMNMMVNSLPSAGVRKLLVIGSKFDSGVLDYPKANTTLNEAAQRSIQAYNNQYRNNLKMLSSNNPAMEKKLRDIEPMYISSLMHSVLIKQKSGKPLSSEENHIIKQCGTRFSDFELSERTLKRMSGIGVVRSKLVEVIKEKEEIINGKNNELLNDTKNNFIRLIDTICEDVRGRASKMRSSTIEELKVQYSDLINILESSRIQLHSVFDKAAAEAEKLVIRTEGHIETECSNVPGLHIKSKTHEEHGTVKVGIFKKEHYTVNVTEYSAETSEVVTNIHQYIGKCKNIIDTDFNDIINTHELTKNVKEVVIKAMHAGGGKYTEDDVLMPLNAVLTKITIPRVTVNTNEYIDMVNVSFKSGVAKNDDIHALSALQSRVISQIFEELSASLRDCVKQIKNMLMEQSNTFTDQIVGKLKDEFEGLQNNINNREEYIEKCEGLAARLADMRRGLSEVSRTGEV